MSNKRNPHFQDIHELFRAAGPAKLDCVVQKLDGNSVAIYIVRHGQNIRNQPKVLILVQCREVECIWADHELVVTGDWDEAIDGQDRRYALDTQAGQVRLSL